MRKLQLLLLSSLIVLSSCHFFGGERVSGNGHIITQQKQVGSFNNVEVSGSVKVHVKQEATNLVNLKTDENLFELIEVFTDGNTLVIRTKKGFDLHPSEDIIVYVSAPFYKDIDVSGACDIISDGVITGTEALSMHVSGSGDISMDVNLPNISTDISGSGEIN